ncbi:MAG: hypothetical protein V4645_10145 [Pseudomonadota bacterium]
MTNSIETSESEALPWAPRGAAAPAQPALEAAAEPFVDKFKGDNAHLARCIQALLNLDARGALVPHGLGGHARDLLAAAACRLPLAAAVAPPAPVKAAELKALGGWKLVPIEPTLEMLDAFQQGMRREFGMKTTAGYHGRIYRAMLAAAQEAALPVVTDEAILALNAGERFFSESPSKYPEAGFGTQYHAGKPGVLQFAHAVLALTAPTQAPAGGPQ